MNAVASKTGFADAAVDISISSVLDVIGLKPIQFDLVAEVARAFSMLLVEMVLVLMRMDFLVAAVTSVLGAEMVRIKQGFISAYSPAHSVDGTEHFRVIGLERLAIEGLQFT